MHIRVFAWIVVFHIAVLLIACAGAETATISLARTVPPGVPAVGTLDLLHAASVTAEHPFDVGLFYDSHLVSALGESAQFNSAADTLAYAIYQAAPEGSELLALNISAIGEFWVLLPDFAAGSWVVAGTFSDGFRSIDLSGYNDLLSPGNFFYCAVLCQSPPEGMGNLLLALELTYDIPLPDPHTYYVATPANGGADANPGTPAAPWATLQHAADTVQAGDTVLVGAGDFQGFMLQTSGVTSHPVTFDGQGLARIISDNPTTADGINLEDWNDGVIHHVVIEGFRVVGATRAGIRFVGGEDEHAHHIEIRDNECDSNGTWGIFCGFADDFVVTGNECSRSGDEHGIYLSNSCKRYTCSRNTCWGNNGCGIHNNGDLDAGGDGINADCFVDYNIIYDNGAGGGSGLNFDTVRGFHIRGNLLYNNHASGISIYSVSGLGSENNYVINNTIIQPADGRWCLNIQDGTTGTVVYNNILYNHHSFRGSLDIAGNCLTGLDSDYNIVMDRFVVDDGATLSLAAWQAQSDQDAHSFLATPAELFTDPLSNDFHLLAAGPAHDAGTMLGIEFSPMPTSDIDLINRPQGLAMDIGAFELPFTP